MNLNSTEEITPSTLRKFSIGAAFIFIFLSFYFYKRNFPELIFGALGLSLLFLLIGLLKPDLASPVYTAWMKLAFGMNFVITRVILFIVFVLTVVPMGILLRLFKKDILDKNIEKEKSSYWVPRETGELNIKHYERHF